MSNRRSAQDYEREAQAVENNSLFRAFARWMGGSCLGRIVVLIVLILLVVFAGGYFTLSQPGTNGGFLGGIFNSPTVNNGNNNFNNGNNNFNNGSTGNNNNNPPFNNNPPVNNNNNGGGNPQFGYQSKTSNCQVNGPFQDTACTPGAIISTATKDQICVSGYSSSVRNVPTSEKDQVYAEYGIVHRTTGEFEVDHLISLELGGSNDISNLWPEAASPKPGFHEKDKVENYLHDQVCRGAISLQAAQQEIATNWLTVYQQMGGN